MGEAFTRHSLRPLPERGWNNFNSSDAEHAARTRGHVAAAL
jgi:hypothetical protein